MRIARRDSRPVVPVRVVLSGPNRSTILLTSAQPHVVQRVHAAAQRTERYRLTAPVPDAAALFDRMLAFNDAIRATERTGVVCRPVTPEELAAWRTPPARRVWMDRWVTGEPEQ